MRRLSKSFVLLLCYGVLTVALPQLEPHHFYPRQNESSFHNTSTLAPGTASSVGSVSTTATASPVQNATSTLAALPVLNATSANATTAPVLEASVLDWLINMANAFNAYKNVTCDQGIITQLNEDPVQRWNETQGDFGLIGLATYWQDNNKWNESTEHHATSEQIYFINSVLQWAGNTETGWDCTDTGSNPCSSSVECDDVNTPAAYLILNSMVTLHNLYSDLWHAVVAAQGNMNGMMVKFAETFSPQLEEKISFWKKVLDVVQFGAAIVSAGVWNVPLKTISAFTSSELSRNMHGAVKDSFNAGIAFAINWSKDSAESKKSELSTLGDDAAALTAMVENIQVSNNEYLKYLFGGSEDGFSRLQNMIKGGVMIPKMKENVADLTKLAMHTLYGLMIPMGWAASPQNIKPLMIMTRVDCPDKANDGRISWYKDRWPHAFEAVQKNWACVDDKYAFLIRADADDDSPSAVGYDFDLMPGSDRDTLNGESWGGATLEDMLTSAWHGYQMAGMKNGYEMDVKMTQAVDGDGAAGDLFFQNGLRTPGLFNFWVDDWQYETTYDGMLKKVEDWCLGRKLKAREEVVDA